MLRQWLACVVLALTGVFCVVADLDAGPRCRRVTVCTCTPECSLDSGTSRYEVMATPILIQVKGAIFNPAGALRLSTPVYIWVTTAEVTPVQIGGSATAAITTGATNGNYLITYDAAMLGTSKQINVNFKKVGSPYTVTVGPLAGPQAPTGFGLVIDAIVLD